MYWREHTRYFLLREALVVNDQWGRGGVGGGFRVDLTNLDEFRVMGV